MPVQISNSRMLCAGNSFLQRTLILVSTEIHKHYLATLVRLFQRSKDTYSENEIPQKFESLVEIHLDWHPKGTLLCSCQFTNLELEFPVGQPHVAKRCASSGSTNMYRNLLSVEFGNQRRVCNGCKDAHTEEELKVWMDAHQAESIKRSDKVDHYNSSSSKKYYFSSQSGASSSSSRCEECPRWYS